MKEDKTIQQLKDSLEKDYGREFTSEEVERAYSNLNIFAQLLYKSFQKDHQLKVQLRAKPQGFPVVKGGNCLLCGTVTSLENSWYDKNGLMCLPCHEAIKSELIPVSAISDKDSWYSKHELETFFNLKGADLRKCIRDEFLINTCVLKKNKKVHLELFLISDNDEVLPPKDLIKNRVKKISRNGKEYFISERWFEYADENMMHDLCKFRIVEILTYTFSKPIEGGDFLIEVGTINPLFKFKDGVLPNEESKPLNEFPASAPGSHKRIMPSNNDV
jgi:hypothetical protein